MKKKSCIILLALFFTVWLFLNTVSYAEEDTVEAEPAHPPTKSISIELNSFPDDVDSTLIDDETEFHFIQASDQVPADNNDITSRLISIVYIAPIIIILFVLIKY